MSPKKSKTFGAKIMICAMLMLLTASVANASVAGDFSFNAVGSVTVSGGTTDNLALEFVMPDGTNNTGVYDTLRHDGANSSWTGDALTAFSVNEFYLDDNYDTAWDWFTPEAIWTDLDTDSRIDAGEIALAGLADLEAFNAAGNTLWVADSYAGDLPVGLTGGTYNSADYDAGEAIFEDVDGTLSLGPGDTLHKNGTAGVINFTTPAINPGGVCGTGAGGCNGNLNIDDFYFCDGIIGGVLTPAAVNGIYEMGETVYADLIGGIPFDFDPGDLLMSDAGGLIGLGSCIGPGGTAVSLTAVPQPLIFLDADKAGTYGDTGIFPPGAPVAPLAPWGEPLIYLSTVPIGDFGILATTNFGGILIADPMIALSAPDYDVFDGLPMNLAAGGNLRFIGYSAGVDPYNGTSTIVDDSANPGILDPGEIVQDASFGPGGVINQSFGLVHKYVDTGSGWFESTEDIYDESTASIAFTVETGPDQLDDMTIQNAGTMLNTDIAAVNLWADVGILGTFEPLADTLVGTGVWDGTNGWDFTGLGYAISAMSPGVNNFFVSVDLVASPQSCKSINLFIPSFLDNNTVNAYDANDEGVFVVSTNDGPIGGAASPATTNVLSTACGGGGGTGGGSSVGTCGDGILDETESCDDGGRQNGDGCNIYCSLEDGYVWDAEAGEVVLESELEEGEEEETTEEETTGEEATPETVTAETLEATDIENVASNFSDYDENHWAAEYIAKLFLANIMTGYGDGDMFGVAEGTTRAEIVKIALLANGIEVPETIENAPFLDTPVGEWYTPYIAKAGNLGIVEGYDDGNFRPGNKVNRAEALKILLLAKNVDLEGYDLSSATTFSDVSETIWYAVYVAYGVDMDLIEGYADGTFKGGNDILRAEIAKLTVMIMLLEMAEETV